MIEMSDASTETIAIKGGMYLTFVLNKEVYGLEILKVQEIIGMVPITAVPGSPPQLRGVINLRGKVIPVLDLRRKLGLEEAEDTEKTCIVLLKVVFDGRTRILGITVDEVCEVLRIVEDQIEPPPCFNVGVRTDHLLGIGKAGGRVILLLDANLTLVQE
jgi:purine-binding chemotaxis protein CheW